MINGFTVVICFIATIYITSAVYADIFKYTDDSNAVCITNNLDSVPKKFRSSVKITKEDVLPSQQKLLPEVQQRTTDPPPASTQLQPQSEPQKESRDMSAEARKKYMKTGLVLTGIVAGYFILTWLTGSLGFPRIGMSAFLLIVLAGGVYLYNLYIKEMSATFSNLRKDALGMKKNIETRENKTEQMLNKLPGVE